MPPRPPVPPRRPHLLEAHGDRRVDDYYWLADREDPEVLAHLRAENAYAEVVLAPLAGLRQALYQEMVARIVETDLSVPVRRGPWWYYQRTVEGKNYPVHCRRPAAPGQAPPLEADPAEEQVLLDQNLLAEGSEFLQVANLVASPDHRWLAYALDTTGGELYDLHFRWLAKDPTPSPAAEETVPATYYGLAWSSDSSTVFYTRVDAAMRPYQLWRHRLGSDPAHDVLVVEEADERFTLSVGRTKDGAFVVVALQSHTTSELLVIPADDPAATPRVVEPRRPGIEYGLEHHKGTFVVLTNDGALDFRVVVAPADTPERPHWHEVVPHRPGTRVEDVDVFERWLVLGERTEGEAGLRLVPLPDDDPFGGELLARSHLVPAGEHPSTTWEGANPEPATTELRYEQTSLVTPHSVLDLDLAAGRPQLRKRQPVLGGFLPERYRTGRLWASAEDGTAVPLSLVYRADLLADGEESAAGEGPPAFRQPAPCLLYGYGAYEHSIDPVFSSLRLSLLDRGMVYAIAHVRGGGELGRRWYEDGKLRAKEHTFTDFIACARHLVASGVTVPQQLVARGASAGGLLIGAIVNRAPELFAAVVAEVPFVDCLTTMLDPALPLTVGEWEEWGDPVTDPAAYATIKAYSPYDNVPPAAPDGPPVRFPRLFVTAGLNDPRVGYWEPAKWVTKLRAADPANQVVLRTELSAGHGGPSGRYDAWRDEALVFAFVLDAVGLAAVTGQPAGAGPGAPAA